MIFQFKKKYVYIAPGYGYLADLALYTSPIWAALYLIGWLDSWFMPLAAIGFFLVYRVALATAIAYGFGWDISCARRCAEMNLECKTCGAMICRDVLERCPGCDGIITKQSK